jgi:hypothetical protein
VRVIAQQAVEIAADGLDPGGIGGCEQTEHGGGGYLVSSVRDGFAARVYSGLPNMPRTLVFPYTSVKVRTAAIASFVLAGALLAGCGSAPPPEPPPDPYAARVLRCIDVPRQASDAAHRAMVDVQQGGGRTFLIDPVPVTEDAYMEFVAACAVDPPQQVLRPQTSDMREWPPIVVVPVDDAGFHCAWRGDDVFTEGHWNAATRARPDLGPNVGFRCVQDR